VQKDELLRAAIDASLREMGGRRGYAHRLADHIGNFATGDPAVARLASLIDERLVLVLEVARYKWNTGAAIEDPPREQALMVSLRQKAAPLGIAEARVDAFFLAQIEAAKQLQRDLFARWQRERREKFPGVADLAGSIRPGIDALTNQMLQTLAEIPAGRNMNLPASTVSGISPGAVRTARAPLLQPGT